MRENFKLTVTEGGSFVLSAFDGELTISPYFGGKYLVKVNNDKVECTVVTSGDIAEISRIMRRLASAALYFSGEAEIEKGGDER